LIAGQGVIRNPENQNAYEVLKILAIGGMSTTYLVYNYQNLKLAVLKEINAQLAKRAKPRELFQREARVLQSLSHPGVPQFYDFFWTDERYSLVMEMVHGQTLEKLVPTSMTEAVNWMLEVANILNYLHNRKSPVIHRDIKPSNLILRYHPREIVLIDFGAVKEATTPPGTCIYTPGYGAPEQQKGTPSIQSDFYGLGTTLVYLLTRKFPSHFYNPRQNRFVGLEESGIPPDLVRIILALTAFFPKERPHTGDELIDLLKQGLEAVS
jgi:serine/threonine-protein kinase